MEAAHSTAPIADPLPVSGDTRLQTEVLEDLSSAFNYRRWVSGLVEPWLGDRPLEVGAGAGDHAQDWSRPGRVITLTEADEGRLERLADRFRDAPSVHVRALRLPTSSVGEHSAVVAINVLEHLADDRSALLSLTRLVHPGGHVVVFVPAFPSAFSAFDTRIGHFRRYRLKGLRSLMQSVGLEVIAIRHVNSIGLLAWFVAMRLLHMQPRAGLLLTAYDRLAVPVVRRFESVIRPPFGQSLFAVARTSSGVSRDSRP